jgi:hypothetical protein
VLLNIGSFEKYASFSKAEVQKSRTSGHRVRWLLIMVDPQYGIGVVSPFWRLEIWGAPYILENLCIPTLRYIYIYIYIVVTSESLSPRHGASSGCGWRNGLLYGQQLRIYWISSRGQPIWGGPPAWGLGEVLTTPHRKNVLCCERAKCGNEHSGSIKCG